MKTIKPLGRKAYGSIGHLPNSRLGPADHCVNEGMARICTEKARDKHDKIIVQEKLDGSCVAVVRIGDEIVPLMRAGYPALSSPYPNHHLFHFWAIKRTSRFLDVLQDGERLVGEWLAQAHGTIYYLEDLQPFAAFDIMRDDKRVPYYEFRDRVGALFRKVTTLHIGKSLSIFEAMLLHGRGGSACDEPEGVVYRVERHGEVEFLAKWVRPDKVDGKYLPYVSGKPEVWNWLP